MANKLRPKGPTPRPKRAYNLPKRKLPLGQKTPGGGLFPPPRRMPKRMPKRIGMM